MSLDEPGTSGTESAPSGDGAALDSDAGVGGAVVAGTDADVAPGSDVQSEPAMDMHDATTREQIDGVVAQTRADFPAGSNAAKVEHALRQRFDEIGIDVTDEQVRSLAAG